jgi:hypothetical protein
MNQHVWLLLLLFSSSAGDGNKASRMLGKRSPLSYTPSPRSHFFCLKEGISQQSTSSRWTGAAGVLSGVMEVFWGHGGEGDKLLNYWNCL